MILSILATVAVLAAIAVIAAALALAETVLVYIALGLAGASVLLLLGGMVQGRIAESRTGRPGTDGLGKSSVPTGAATPAATAAGPHVVPEYSGRVPVPAQGPVREAPAQDTPVWAAADDAGHGEPEYDVPRWQTPTAHEWPEPDTTPAGGTVHAGFPAEANPAAPASEARTDGEPADTAVTADIPQARERAGEDGEAPFRLHTGDDGPEPDPAPFTYSIPGQGSSHEDGAAPVDATADPDDGVAGAGTPEADAFSYRIPGEADRTERAEDDPETGAPDTEQAPAPDVSADGDGEARPNADEALRAEQAVEHAEADSERGEDEPATGGDAGPGSTADGEGPDPEPDTDDTAAQGEREHASSEAEPVPSAHTDTDTDTDTDTNVSAEARAPEAQDADADPVPEDGGRVEDAPAAGTGGAAEAADTGDPAPEAESADDADGAFTYRLPGRGDAAEEGADEAESDRETADAGRTSAFSYRLPQPEDGGAVAERSDRDGDDDAEGAPAADGTADAGDPDTTPAPTRPEPEGDAADGPGDGAGDAEPDGSERPAKAEDEDAEDDHAVAYAAVLDGDTDLDGGKDPDKDPDKVH